jgi:flagellar hook-associated protein 1 FlgK
VDVTAQLAGGRLAELLRLRDSTLPRYQAEMDVAASAMASRLDTQGLTLFTNASGGLPDPSLGYVAGGLTGFSNEIRVAPRRRARPRPAPRRYA